MIASLQFPYFQVQVPNVINGEDLKNLRKFYAPILGSNSILLYEYLRDLAFEPSNPSTFNDYDSLVYLLKMTKKELNDARIKLESVSLISTLIDTENSRTLFIIEKPLDKTKLKNNVLLANMLTNILGEQNFQNLVGKDKKIYFANENYKQDVSATFEEVFEMNQVFENYSLNLEHHNNNQQDTQEVYLAIEDGIKFGEYDAFNPYEGIISSDSRLFYSQLTKKIPSNSIVDLIKDARLAGMPDACINLIFYYAYEVNNRINYNYVKKIICDYIKKDEFSFDVIERQLDQLTKFKNKSYVSKKDLYKSTYIQHIKNLNDYVK